ncbi:MAG: hypothetical protein ACRD3V_04305 [Vicinamibacteria bacterium]
MPATAVTCARQKLSDRVSERHGPVLPPAVFLYVARGGELGL